MDDHTQLINDLISTSLFKVWTLVVPVMALVILKETIVRGIEGLAWKHGRTYSIDDAVVIDKRKGRIIRQSIWTTTFYIYIYSDDNQDVPIGGNILVVSNSELGKLRIEKPLVLHHKEKHHV